MNAEQKAAVDRTKAFTANLYGYPAAVEILKDFEKIEALITELAKDKARLDWMSASEAYEINDCGKAIFTIWEIKPHCRRHGINLRQAIDAAMEAKS